MKKKIMSLVLGATMLVGCFGLGGCGKNSGTSSDKGDAVELSIAYQYGTAYAPAIVMKEEGLIEKHYEEATGKKVNVVWNQMSSGADINTGISSGSVDIGYMGIGPAVTGVSKNIGYKIFSGCSGQESGLMTNDKDVKSLKDLVGSSKQIATVNIGSIQHIMLAKALADNGLDPHALDTNIVAMKHPDGKSAIESGSVACHLTSNPYIYMERDNADLTELEEVKNSWNVENSFIVGVAANSLHDDNPELYKAVCDASAEAMDIINNTPEDAAKITCDLDGNSFEDELKYLQLGYYSVETKGIFELAKFMEDNDFVDDAPDSYNDLVFDNVKGD